MARRSARAAPLAAKWRKLAEGRCAEKGERLTPARLAVYAELLAFAKNAQAEGVTEKEPYRTQLEFARLNFLAQIYLAELQKRARLKEEDFQKYYEENRAEYEERRVYAIYIDYSDNPG